MRSIRVPLLLVAAVVGFGCTSTDDVDAPEVTGVALVVPEVTVPPERLTPFCQRMIELSEQLPDDPSVDATDVIIAAYREALPDVPAEIAAEFAAVLAALESGTEATLPPDPTAVATTGPAAPTSVAGSTPSTAGTGDTAPTTLAPPSAEAAFPEEGYDPDDTPGARVNAYIDATCDGTVNNPGPPPTQPDVAPPTTS